MQLFSVINRFGRQDGSSNGDAHHRDVDQVDHASLVVLVAAEGLCVRTSTR
jgi:hypothetical protein